MKRLPMRKIRDVLRLSAEGSVDPADCGEPGHWPDDPTGLPGPAVPQDACPRCGSDLAIAAGSVRDRP